MEELNASADEVASSAHSLAHVAQTLQQQVAHFQT